ncbi:hypothetical protein B0J11DRAFT_532793 [Dendryphion nanum]|uniref:Uncharacterized protein n=1 Tax=Dendryphion nanum TaxID=256645 RepID=A0A9P9DKK0_9PLEO|nr:hypothetical protein B0J11DRAFT_532793 [Dendryphion nanum]
MNQTTRKSLSSRQPNEGKGGRSTPLPQYSKNPSVPFNLTLQEDKRNPGQFQLVVNIDPEHKKRDGSPPKSPSSTKLYTNLQAFPGLGYDVSPLYQTQKSSPPTSPQQEQHGWSDLDAIHPDFLEKVVPDWEVTFQRKDSTASTQSRKLSDIKAKIKKSGKGFVVRLLKGSSPESNEVAEVHLGTQTEELSAVPELDSSPQAELDSSPQAELDSTEVATSSLAQGIVGEPPEPTVFEIGTSGEQGIQRRAPPASRPVTAVPEWLRTTTFDISSRNSILEEGFSDAETLTQDIRPFGADVELSSRLARTASTSSIVKTPTRGLSVVGPVKRIAKGDKARNGKGRIARSDLNRSDANKSFRGRSPRGSSSNLQPQHSAPSNSKTPPAPWVPQQEEDVDGSASDEDGTWAHPMRERPVAKEKILRRPSADALLHPPTQKARLKLQTNVSRPKSANSSPVTKRKKNPRSHKPSSSSSSVHFADEVQHVASPAWSEVDASAELREALEQAFGTSTNNVDPTQDTEFRSVPRIEEPQIEENVGGIPLPSNYELRPVPQHTGSPMLTYWSLAVSALSEKAFEGLYALRLRYGSEPPVPHNQVRVRWTCSCGEPLYDDFIERRPGAARLLEAYLNRPRTHTPTISPTGRTSTSSTMSSVFSSVSTASTLATPASTYGGPSSWGRTGNSSKFSPTRIRSNNPFSVRIGSYVEEQWLLTCANEGRFTPKIVHIDVNEAKVKSDKDLALALRGHYEQLNHRWLKWARLRGLTTIEFVQFEVHRNRFADIRASPSMPPRSSTTTPKAPSEEPYSFEPVDLMPPVGSTYLLHLFKHPSDYDGELITYLRAPKRRERLEFGMGWGINLVEGFLAQRVWLFLMTVFGVGSAIFAILWTIKKGDVQGAFGVAGWVVTLAGLVLGGLQAWLD